jgi:hypothetical protein
VQWNTGGVIALLQSASKSKEVVRITFQLVAPKPSAAGVNVRIEACVLVIALMRQRKKGYVAKDGTHGLPVSSPFSVLQNQIRCDRRTVHGVIRLM